MKFTFGPEARPLDGYTIQRPIQKGGFGEVYFAVSDAGKEVALKLLQHNLEIELRGVRQCLNLKHPNLVTIFDIKQDADNDHWIVMEYVHGRTLMDRLEDAPRGLPVDEVARWVQMLSGGLDFLHDRGIVHRDLKPANLFEEDGVVKIGDVGLSKFIAESRRGGQTQSVGTVYYMAPEVSRGQYGKELDIYSLGVITFEMLCGQLPFEGETAGEILMKHLTELPDLTKIPVPFRSVIAGALEKDPAKRTRRAGQFWNEFQAAMQREGMAVPAGVSSQERLRAEVRNAAGNHGHAHAPAARNTQPWEDSLGTVGDWLYRHRKSLLWGLLAALILAPGLVLATLQPMIRILIFAAAMGVLAIFIYRIYAYIRDQETLRQSELASRRDRPIPVSVSTDHRTKVTPPSRLIPGVPREIPFSQRMGELFSSLAVATFITAGVTFLLHAFTQHLPTWQAATTFGLCTLVPAWVILAECKWLEGRSIDPYWRRGRMALLGGLSGAAMFGLYSLLSPSLMIPVDVRQDALIDRVGTHPLQTSDGLTMIAFILFFGALFGLRRWWWRVDSLRADRVSVWSLFGTFLLSLILPQLILFPMVWSSIWAMSISAIVQLSAVWILPHDRKALHRPPVPPS